jgi:hypothetical protein
MNDLEEENRVLRMEVERLKDIWATCIKYLDAKDRLIETLRTENKDLVYQLQEAMDRSDEN